MDFSPQFTLSVQHAFSKLAPIQIKLVSSDVLKRPDLHFKSLPSSGVVYSAIEDPEELILKFHVLAKDPSLFDVTVLPDGIAAFDVTLADGESRALAVSDNTDSTALDPGQPRLSLLATVQVTLALPQQNPCTLSIDFSSRQSFWVYHIVGGDPEAVLSVHDPKGAVKFSRTDNPTLPSDRLIRSFLSDAPIAMKQRPEHTFALNREGPFGAQTVVATLPGAVSGTRQVTTGEDTSLLQSDIYVNL